ncbi:hypothetical protein BCR34DRAFT_575035 [Clohesyomyces aquaticus]|uniref:F-box domain-containing protein n=1 Tax=Clohesyomyces aquaticus TaxID=1231657 RepID=A0A1Y1YTJ8_9PLEO|nr:hypothetical protein BCR34DRAFT_575035 [Clohesyomyces aquaticus]
MLNRSLPNELQVLIFQKVTLRDLLALRFVSRQTSELILSHCLSIAPSVASNTFPQAKRLLLATPYKPLDLSWLEGLVPRYIAAVLLDRYILSCNSLGWTYCIPAESDIGDELRGDLTRGVRIWKDLSKISKEVYILSIDKLPSRTPKERLRGVLAGRCEDKAKQTTRRKENLAMQRRRAYLRRVSVTDIHNFNMVMFLVCVAFKTKHDQPPLRPYVDRWCTYNGVDDFDWCAKDRRPNSPDNILLEDGNSWVNWAILHDGPVMFYQQWSPENVSSQPVVKETLMKRWQEQTAEEIEIKRKAFVELRDEFNFDFHHPRYSRFEESLQAYAAWDLGLRRFHSKEPVPNMGMDDVLYFINFKNNGQPRRRQQVESVLEYPYDPEYVQ